MAFKPKRPCNKIGCRNITTERYCEDHADIVDQQRKERHKHYDKHQRDKQTARFYNSKEWERVRQQAIIKGYGLCVECLKDKRIKPYDAVDHIKPTKLFWELRSTLSNLQLLCHQHHAVKTAEDKRRYGQ